MARRALSLLCKPAPDADRADVGRSPRRAPLATQHKEADPSGGGTQRRATVCVVSRMVWIRMTVPSLQTALSQKRFAADIVCAEEAAECAHLLQLAANPVHEQNQNYINGLNLAVLALLMEKVGLKDKVPSAESDLVRELLMYLQNHFSEELTVAGTAAQFGYSAGRFSHIFNARVGCSFTRYVNGLRCRMAEKVLRESNMPLMDVASACGFSSMRTFHRVYREYAGHTPRRATP